MANLTSHQGYGLIAAWLLLIRARSTGDQVLDAVRRGHASQPSCHPAMRLAGPESPRRSGRTMGFC
jgi:hypothetical protein